MEKKFKIRKNDTVEVIAGKDKGKRGTVLRVLYKKDAVIVSGVNIVKKAMKKRSAQDQGGIVEIEAPLNISNVGIVCKKCVFVWNVVAEWDGETYPVYFDLKARVRPAVLLQNLPILTIRLVKLIGQKYKSHTVPQKKPPAFSHRGLVIN